MAADRDVEPGEQEREGEVDEDRRAEPRLHRVDAAGAQEHDARAHQPEHGARGADRVGVRAREQDRAERARQQRGEVDAAEAPLAEARLEQLPEDVEQVHVEADVDEAERALGVQEAAGDRPPQVAVGDRTGREHEVEVRRRAAARAEEHQHVDPDQHVGQHRVAVDRWPSCAPACGRASTPGSACRPGWASCSPGRSACRSSSTRPRSRDRDGDSTWPWAARDAIRGALRAL